MYCHIFADVVRCTMVCLQQVLLCLMRTESVFSIRPLAIPLSFPGDVLLSTVTMLFDKNIRSSCPLPAVTARCQLCLGPFGTEKSQAYSETAIAEVA